MEIKKFIEIIGSDFYVGVPDSQLKCLCDYLYNNYGIDNKHHIIAANEGNGVAIAAGYNLATKKIPVVYLQNSGEGNIINPIASLTSEMVYSIPMIFIIGWRGEPGVHDEPQHIFQGKITLDLLKCTDIEYFVVDKNTKVSVLEQKMVEFRERLNKGRSVAFVISKDALSYSNKSQYFNSHSINREDAVKCLLKYTKKNPIISTTGKVSRELFELREHMDCDHSKDFLTVGSMGHSSSIAFGVALSKPNTKIWCIDGDGAAIMHMGSLAVIGAHSPNNFVHVLINNEAHESVGGMPTVASKIEFSKIALACGYKYISVVDNIIELEKELDKIVNNNMLTFIEIKCAIGSRKDLGRPTIKPIDNKIKFVEYLERLN